jgi:hypothetical protein
MYMALGLLFPHTFGLAARSEVQSAAAERETIRWLGPVQNYYQGLQPPEIQLDFGAKV